MGEHWPSDVLAGLALGLGWTALALSVRRLVRSGVGADEMKAPALPKSTKRATSLLILSSKAGSMTPKVEAKIRKEFANSLIVEFDPKMDLEKLVTPQATIIVAGGDGTIGWVVRRLAETKHPLGIISMGTSTTLRSR